MQESSARGSSTKPSAQNGKRSSSLSTAVRDFSRSLARSRAGNAANSIDSSYRRGERRPSRRQARDFVAPIFFLRVFVCMRVCLHERRPGPPSAFRPRITIDRRR